ncbi:MAG: DMT family transporter, partial [Nitriliruptorales bacterium]
MTRLHLATLLAVGAIWGATPMLNKIALRGFSPATLTAGRIAFGAAVIVAVLVLTSDRRGMVGAFRAAPRPLALAGVLNAAAPFFLIAWGQQWIASGLAGILISSAPLFTVLMATPLDRRERVTGLRLAGFLVGFGGVVLLLATSPGGGRLALAGSLAVVAAAFLYAVGALYVGRSLRGVQPPVVAAGTLAWA